MVALSYDAHCAITPLVSAISVFGISLLLLGSECLAVEKTGVCGSAACSWYFGFRQHGTPCELVAI